MERMYNCTFCDSNFNDVNSFSAHVCGRDNLEKESGNRKWSVQMTRLLLCQYKEHFQKKRPGCTTKRMFEIIAENMQLFGYSNITGPMCDEKYRGLLRSYKKVKDRKKTTGSSPCYFQFYNEMDDILGERPEMEAPVTYDSTDLEPRYRGDRPTQAESSPSTSADISNISPPAAMHVEVDNDNSEASNKPKRKELPFWCKEMFKKFDEKEKNHERRHRERMEMQRQLLDHLKKKDSD